MCTNYSFRIESERYQILASNVKGSIKAKGMQIIESKAKAMQTRSPVASKAKGKQLFASNMKSRKTQVSCSIERER